MIPSLSLILHYLLTLLYDSKINPFQKPFSVNRTKPSCPISKRFSESEEIGLLGNQSINALILPQRRTRRRTYKFSLLQVFYSQEDLAVSLAKCTAKFCKERGSFTVILSGDSLIKCVRSQSIFCLMLGIAGK